MTCSAPANDPPALPGYPEEWRRVVPQVRIMTTLTSDEPRQRDWLDATPIEGGYNAPRQAEALAAELYGLGRAEWVWVGHNGPYTPGMWKWWIRIGPPGWISDAGLRELELERGREQDAERARIAAAAAKKERDRLRREGKITKLDKTDSIVAGGAQGHATTAAPVEGAIQPDPDLPPDTPDEELPF